MTIANTKTIKAINRNLDEKIDGIINWLPAKIIKYDAEKHTADVKPLINISDGEGNFIELPIIPSVHVMQYSCALFSFKIPHKEGDIVRVVFTNTGLEGFEASGDVQDEDITSRCSLTNCFIMPAEYSNNTNSFEVTEAGELKIKMKKSATIEAGTVKIFTNISNQMEKVIASLTQIATALTALGGDATLPPMSPTPQPLTVKGQMLSAGSQVSSAVTEITQLKQQLDQVI